MGDKRFNESGLVRSFAPRSMPDSFFYNPFLNWSFVMKKLLTGPEIAEMVFRAFRRKKRVDIHVHDMPDCMGEFALSGPDKLIDYHYLYGQVASELRLSPTQMKKIWAMPLEKRVDYWVKHSFLKERLHLSEGEFGILKAANALGLPTASGNFRRVLKEWREMYRDLGAKKYTDNIFDLANILEVVSTQSVLVEAEEVKYLDDRVMAKWDPRYACGLRLDELIHKPDELRRPCELAGFPNAAGDLSIESNRKAARELVKFWVKRLPNVKYLAVSLSGKTNFSDSASREMIVLEQILVPVAKETGLTIMIMPFVRRQINPSFRNAGDVVERGDIDGLIDFISKHGDVLFGVTPLDANDNYALSFASRALRNLIVWGHWWCNLNPVLIEQQLRLRIENNGYTHFGVNSDARIRDQLLFKFPNYLRILAKVLAERCLTIQEETGWPITERDIEGTVDTLQDPTRILAA